MTAEILKFLLRCFFSPQLTQQLDDLRRGRLQLHSIAPGQGGPQGGPSGQKGSPLSGPAAMELRKLYQELQVDYSTSLLPSFNKIKISGVRLTMLCVAGS